MSATDLRLDLKEVSMIDIVDNRCLQFATAHVLCSSALKTPNPHFRYISEPSGHEDSPGTIQNIPYLFKKISKSRLSDRFFGLYLVTFEVLHSENSDFKDLSVFGDYYVFYHFVCHRYT